MNLRKLKERVLKKIKPSEEEIEREFAFAERVMEQIRQVEGPHIECVLAGSIARKTHLRNDRDIDVFVLFPEKLNREEFEKEGLKLGKKIFGKNPWEEAYTEHPYVRGKLEGFDLEIVPSYKVEKAEELKSAVDRSPFHTAYLNGKLNDKLRDEVRLLRQFFKGIKCYGADLKFGSVPGYVVELLVLNYGDFENVLKDASEWKTGEVIDIEKQLSNEEVRKKFDEPLVVVDPVDKNRNVAAALSLNQFARFTVASREFLKKPKESYFFGKKHKAWNALRLKKILAKKEMSAVEFAYPKGVVSDIVWGQLRKVRRKLVKHLEMTDFKVINCGDWTDEKESCVIILEFESRELSKSVKRFGPPVTETEDSEKFLDKHKKPLAGPRIEEGRWVIETERKLWKAGDFIRDYVKKLKKEEKPEMKKALARRFRVLREKDIVRFYGKHKGFQEFFTGYLKGKEEVLDY